LFQFAKHLPADTARPLLEDLGDADLRSNMGIVRTALVNVVTATRYDMIHHTDNPAPAAPTLLAVAG
jgi:hypothetical protein